MKRRKCVAVGFFCAGVLVTMCAYVLLLYGLGSCDNKRNPCRTVLFLIAFQ